MFETFYSILFDVASELKEMMSQLYLKENGERDKTQHSITSRTSVIKTIQRIENSHDKFARNEMEFLGFMRKTVRVLNHIASDKRNDSQIRERFSRLKDKVESILVINKLTQE